MENRERAAAFLRAHKMHPEQLALDTLARDFREEMRRGLAGEASSLGMFPAYLRAGARAARDESVLVIDAGGTNLRAARMRLTADGMVTEELRRARMPGTDGEIDAREMFEAIAALVLPLSEGCARASFCFSYPCEVLPDGEGRMIRLTKELHVRGLEGGALCAPLEAALRSRGAKGTRRWRLLNDTVGSLLGGMTQRGENDPADDYIGFILGTGANTCCPLRAESIVKAPAAAAIGGDVLVNLESGGFARFPRGDGDKLLDAASEKPGAQWAEKAIAGAYLPALLRQTLELAAADGALAPETYARFAAARPGMREVDLLCAGTPDAALDALLGDARPFAGAVCAGLIERAAKLTAGILAGILAERGESAGGRVCVCADGTTFRLNPLLRPRLEDFLREGVTARGGPAVEFFEVRDATLLGAAVAGLMD